MSDYLEADGPATHGHPAPSARAGEDRGSSLMAWVLACVLGEAVGLTASGAVGALAVPLLAEGLGSDTDLLLEGMMVLAGALEGTCVGIAQWLVLRRRIAIPPGPWVAATAGGFATGWLAGGLIAMLEPELGLSSTPASIILVGAASGLCLGAVVGLLQALVLRRHARPLAPWMLANAVAWACGMVVAYLGASNLDPGPYDPGHLVLGLATGALVGLAVGLVTGVAERRLKTA